MRSIASPARIRRRSSRSSRARSRPSRPAASCRRCRARALRPASRSGAAARARADIITDIQRELSRRGSMTGRSTACSAEDRSAIRDFEAAAKLKPSGEPTENCCAPSSRAGQVRGCGTARPRARSDRRADRARRSASSRCSARSTISATARSRRPATTAPRPIAAIQKFERDRKLPVTGQISPRLLRELAALTGRPLE